MSMIHREPHPRGLVAALVGAAAAADEKETSRPSRPTPSQLRARPRAPWKEGDSQVVHAESPDEDRGGPRGTTTKGRRTGRLQLRQRRGSVESNIDRWEKQFVDADKRTPKAKVEKKKGVNVDVTRVEVSGRFVAAVSHPVPPRRSTGAEILPAPRRPSSSKPRTPAQHFFKLTGPDKTVADASKAFDSLIESMNLDK